VQTGSASDGGRATRATGAGAGPNQEQPATPGHLRSLGQAWQRRWSVVVPWYRESRSRQAAAEGHQRARPALLEFACGGSGRSAIDSDWRIRMIGGIGLERYFAGVRHGSTRRPVAAHLQAFVLRPRIGRATGSSARQQPPPGTAAGRSPLVEHWVPPATSASQRRTVQQASVSKPSPCIATKRRQLAASSRFQLLEINPLGSLAPNA